MHGLIEQHRDEIAALCRRFGVKRLEVFGSAARGDDFDPITSDVDFLVAFDEGVERPAWDRRQGLSDALEVVLGRAVDLVNPAIIANPYIVASIKRARELIYGT